MTDSTTDADSKAITNTNAKNPAVEHIEILDDDEDRFNMNETNATDTATDDVDIDGNAGAYSDGNSVSWIDDDDDDEDDDEVENDDPNDEDYNDTIENENMDEDDDDGDDYPFDEFGQLKGGDPIGIEYVNGDCNLVGEMLTKQRANRNDEDDDDDNNANDDDNGNDADEDELIFDELEPDDSDYTPEKSVKRYTKRRPKTYKYESNRLRRQKHQRRLLQLLNNTVQEYTQRVGHQAVVLVAQPINPNPRYSVFGARPLRNVVRHLKDVVIEELNYALKDEMESSKTPEPIPMLELVNQDREKCGFELPPLEVEGVPVPVERMTQSQLRAFIPLMLKYSTGRGKPGWGRESTKPKWWPKKIPWANVRMDARTDDEKHETSWTDALRKIVRNCYLYHGRSDLLPKVAANKRLKRPLEIEPESNPVVTNKEPMQVAAAAATVAAAADVQEPERKQITLIRLANSNNSFIQLPNNCTFQMPKMNKSQTIQLDRSIDKAQTITASAINNTPVKNEVVDLTEDVEEMNHNEMTLQRLPPLQPLQKSIPMVVIPQSTQFNHQQQSNILNMSSLQSNSIIYLKPMGKAGDTNYITIPASALNGKLPNQQKILQIVQVPK